MQGCNETITVVNRYTDSGQNAYAVRVIHGCSWYWKDTVTADTTGLQRDRSLRCRIPVSADGASGYVTPQMWKDITPSERPGKWTLQPGDMVCRGKLESVPQGKFNSIPSIMEAATIRSVHDNRRGAMQHWAVEGE